MIQLQHSANIYLGKNQRESNLITCRIIHQANVISEKTCYRAVGRSENLRGQIVIQGPHPFEGEVFAFILTKTWRDNCLPLRFRRPCAKDVLQRFVCLSLEPSLRIAVSREKSAKVNEGFNFRYFSICSSFFTNCKDKTNAFSNLVRSSAHHFIVSRMTNSHFQILNIQGLSKDYLS